MTSFIKMSTVLFFCAMRLACSKNPPNTPRQTIVPYTNNRRPPLLPSKRALRDGPSGSSPSVCRRRTVFPGSNKRATFDDYKNMASKARRFPVKEFTVALFHPAPPEREFPSPMPHKGFGDPIRDCFQPDEPLLVRPMCRLCPWSEVYDGLDCRFWFFRCFEWGMCGGVGY